MLQYRGTMQGKKIVRHIEVDDLRFLLNVDEAKYKLMAEFKRRMDYALELAEKRKVKDLPAFLYKAIEQDYRKRDADIRAAVECEVQAKADNAAWEMDAIRMFGDTIALDVEEEPIDTTSEMGRACIDIIKKGFKECNLTFTGKRLLEQHGMSVARFIELYCQV